MNNPIEDNPPPGNTFNFCNEEYFVRLGLKFSGHKIRRAWDDKINIRRWKSWFGPSPLVCRQLWIALQPFCAIKEDVMPVHLLWALVWLKGYAKESVLAGIAATTEKTFRQYVKMIVQAISDLSAEWVSGE
jgi:hypothetical protein